MWDENIPVSDKGDINNTNESRMCTMETLQTGGKLCALNNCMIRLQSIVLITEHLYDYRTLCKFWSHGEKQMSTKGAVMKFVVKKPKIGIQIHTYFIPLF